MKIFIEYILLFVAKLIILLFKTDYVKYFLIL
jgi:hypothetical protein